MHFSTLFVHGVLTVGALAFRGRRVRRQDGTVDPGQPSDCTWWETKEEDYQDCAYLEDGWGLKHSQFVEYNPSVKDDCSGMQFGHSYCVEVNNGLPREGESSSQAPTTTQAAEPEPTKDSGPSPTQEGLIDTCTTFYQAKKGDTCAKIIDEYKDTFDQDDLFKWNPALGKDCSGVWANYYYCVGVPGTPTKKPSVTTSKPTATATGLQTPSPIQEDFAKWNPAVGSKCTGLWANYNVCVGVIGSTSTKPSTGVTTPSPIQSGMVSNCKKFHPVASITTCDSIQKYYKITMAQLVKWNPAVGSKCTGLWAKYYVCVGV
ncbi:hypothetical protein ACHAPJ_011195 [Fusarium lateritium]